LRICSLQPPFSSLLLFLLELLSSLLPLSTQPALLRTRSSRRIASKAAPRTRMEFSYSRGPSQVLLFRLSLPRLLFAENPRCSLRTELCYISSGLGTLFSHLSLDSSIHSRACTGHCSRQGEECISQLLSQPYPLR
jgi:hypothetical protein